MKQASLVNRAKEIRYKTKYGRVVTQDEVDLALAWCRGEISVTAVSEVMDLQKGTNTYLFLAMVLREFVKKLPEDVIKNYLLNN